MSEFDRLADGFFREANRFFGDEAEWLPGGETIPSIIRLIPDPSYQEIGQGSFGERIATVRIPVNDIPPPISGDTCVIKTGRIAGNYEFANIIEDDGYMRVIQLRRIYG